MKVSKNLSNNPIKPWKPQQDLIPQQGIEQVLNRNVGDKKILNKSNSSQLTQTAHRASVKPRRRVCPTNPQKEKNLWVLPPQLGIGSPSRIIKLNPLLRKQVYNLQQDMVWAILVIQAKLEVANHDKTQQWTQIFQRHCDIYPFGILPLNVFYG